MSEGLLNKLHPCANGCDNIINNQDVDTSIDHLPYLKESVNISNINNLLGSTYRHSSQRTELILDLELRYCSMSKG